MRTTEIFIRALKYWPSEIDISDGEVISETNGFLSENLSFAWNEAEKKAEKNEWDDLSVWIIFGLLHNRAKIDFKKGTNKVYLSQVNIDDFKVNLYEALQNEGYESMLLEYIKTNN